jgi:hypothetical protein
LAVAAIAKAGADRSGGAGGAAEDGRSGKVDGVNGGAVRRMPAPPLLIAPVCGTEPVEVAGPDGTASIIGRGAVLPAVVLATACVVGLAGFSDFWADSADFSDLAAGFADLSDFCASDFCASDLCASDLCAGFAVLSGFFATAGTGSVCGVTFVSDGGAA